MNVKVYASGVLAYDSQLPEERGYSMLSIRIKEGLNKGGSTTLILPAGHRLHDGFPAMSTPVEIYRDGKLRWRGRPLPHSGDFHGRKTITCEGELCFLNDATMRPYALTGTPAELFNEVIGTYNSAVDSWKRFVVGTVSVNSDAPIELAGASPEQIYATVQKLLKSCGGYILFDSAEDGARRINWYAQLPYSCNQSIRLGSNLLDYSSSASVSGFATRIIPYGAGDENGNRIQIDVDGKDYVDNLEAQAERGIIEKYVIYDDVTDPEELRARAEQDLQIASNIPETVQLSALDLSRFDATLDAFALGQMVPAFSAPHSLSGSYAIVALDEDLVQPGVGSVTLTRDAQYYDGAGDTLTGTVNSSQKNQEAVASAAAKNVINAQTWEETFDKLTNYGKVQGLFRKDDQVYVNVAYLAAGIIASADGSVKIDLLNNCVEVDTVSGNGHPGKIQFSSHGIRGFGWDTEAEDYVMSLVLSMGDNMGDAATATVLNSWLADGGIVIAPGKSGAPAVFGTPESITQIRGKTIELGGKPVTWKDNGDGTFTLIGT